MSEVATSKRQEEFERDRADNVAETWEIFDTLCVTPQFFGSEVATLGWFNDFDDFSEKETHSFFMSRTEGNIGGQYTNKNTVDRVDFVYEAMTIGVSFFAPGVRTLGELANDDVEYRDNFSAHWWETEFPNHCALQFKVQQDIVAEGPAMLFSPGYGPVGAGAAFDHASIEGSIPNGTARGWQPPVQNWAMSQGLPQKSNRFQFPDGIGIPRTASIEAILHVSEYARRMLADMAANITAGNGPYNYIFTDNVVVNVPEYSEFPSRYGIQVSLGGMRYVQQRAQYHA